MLFRTVIVATLAVGAQVACGHILPRTYKPAPFKPTACAATFPVPTTTKHCSISGLPARTGITVPPPLHPKSTWSKPNPTAKWEIALQTDVGLDPRVALPADVEVYDIDIDSNEDTFKALLSATPKKYIICYFSAGTSEDYRDDIGCFNPNPGQQDYGCNYGGESPNEYWLNTTSLEVRRIMVNRLEKAVAKKCDAVDPDNIDGYTNANGIGEQEPDARDFMQFLIHEAHIRGLGIGLKNSDRLALDDILVKDLDFAVVEECIAKNECEKYSRFYSSSKPVFNIEYPTMTASGKTEEPTSIPWSQQQGKDRCAKWVAYGTKFNNKFLRTNLQNYYDIDCGVARCEGPSPVPSILSDTATGGAKTGGGLQVPTGCTTRNEQKMLPRATNL